MTLQRIVLNDAHFHELVAHVVQCHARLLTLGFDGYRQDMRLLGGHPDRLRIHGIGFVAQQEGFDLLGWEHFDLMAQRREGAARSVMGAAASLHRNKAFLALGEEIGELGTFDLAAGAHQNPCQRHGAETQSWPDPDQ